MKEQRDMIKDKRCKSHGRFNMRLMRILEGDVRDSEDKTFSMKRTEIISHN